MMIILIIVVGMTTSTNYYKTVDWFEIPMSIKKQLLLHIQDIASNLEPNTPFYRLDTSKAWYAEYGITVKSHHDSWRVHFKDESGYVKFVLRWM